MDSSCESRGDQAKVTANGSQDLHLGVPNLSRMQCHGDFDNTVPGFRSADEDFRGRNKAVFLEWNRVDNFAAVCPKDAGIGVKPNRCDQAIEGRTTSTEDKSPLRHTFHSAVGVIGGSDCNVAALGLQSRDQPLQVLGAITAICVDRAHDRSTATAESGAKRCADAAVVYMSQDLNIRVVFECLTQKDARSVRAAIIDEDEFESDRLVPGTSKIAEPLLQLRDSSLLVVYRDDDRHEIADMIKSHECMLFGFGERSSYFRTTSARPATTESICVSVSSG